VGVHVESQVIDLVEGFVADGALVLLLSAVGQLVVLVVACGRGRRWKEGVTRGCPGRTGKAGRDGGDALGSVCVRVSRTPVRVVKPGPRQRGAARNWHGTNERRGQPGDPRQTEGSGLGRGPGTSHLKSI